jgi:hypothetical protein
MEGFPVFQAVVEGLFGAAGMLVGGFVVYHRVEGLLANLKTEIARVEGEQRDELKQIWAKFDMVMPLNVCRERQAGCGVQFAVFKDGQEELKALFREMRGDFKAELKLLRDCIASATSGRC